MSSVKLDTLIDEFPEEREAVMRLVTFIEECLRSKQVARPVTPQRMYDIVHPSSQRVLLKMLARAIEYGYVDKVLRVTSDASGGIGDFKSVLDIPNVIFDSRRGVDIEVHPDQIKLMYMIPGAAQVG